ncbi:hypothetical protein LINPERPRIM_LOCUS19192 [Linum perenne]
MRTLIINMC